MELETRHYIILRHRNHNKLAEMVSEIIAKGYLPSGELVVYQAAKLEQPWHYQALIRKDHVGR